MKKMISLLLCGLLTMGSLVSCNNKVNQGTKTSSDTTSKQNASIQNTNEENSAEPICFSLYIDHPWFWTDVWGEDPISKKITEITGVSFDITRASDGQQLALLIAADDLTDFVYTSTPSAMALLSDSGVSYSYNELIAETGVNIYATESEIQNNTQADGNYYALLNAYTSQEAIEEGNTLLSGGTRSLAYRTDIYEELGSPEINSLEDLEKVLLAAKEKYPKIIPLLPDAEYLWYFAEQLGLKGSNKIGYDKDGNPCHFLNIDGMNEYFEILNRFGRQGLIIPESLTYNYDRFVEVRNSGNSFMQLRATDEAKAANAAAREAGTDYQWKLLTHELDEKALVNVNTGIGWSGMYISKKNPNPQRAIEFMSWCRSEEGRKLTAWGIQGEHWDYNENGETVTTPAYRKLIDEGMQRTEDLGIAMWIFGDQGDENAFIDYAATNPDLIDFTERLKSAVKHTQVMSELYFCIPTSGDEANIYYAINDMYNSELPKIMFAETDEAFQQAVANLYQQAEDMGLSKLNSWMKVQLENHQAQTK